MDFARFLLVLLVVCLAGCGSGETTMSVEEAPAEDQIRSALQSVADTGMVDSGLMVVREKLEEMKETDAAKAEALLKDLDQLESLRRNPAQARAKAQEMIQKL